MNLLHARIILLCDISLWLLPQLPCLYTTTTTVLSQVYTVLFISFPVQFKCCNVQELFCPSQSCLCLCSYFYSLSLHFFENGTPPSRMLPTKIFFLGYLVTLSGVGSSLFCHFWFQNFMLLKVFWIHSKQFSSGWSATESLTVWMTCLLIFLRNHFTG